VVAAENGVTLAQLALAQLLQLSGDDADGIDVAPPSDDLLETTQLPLSADAAVAFARSAFPDMKAAELQVTDAYLGLDLAKAARLPRINGSYSVGSGYSQNRQTAVVDPVSTNFTIETTQGIPLTVPVETSEGVYRPCLSKTSSRTTSTRAFSSR
jgi:outer membrane protein TolC